MKYVMDELNLQQIINIYLGSNLPDFYIVYLYVIFFCKLQRLACCSQLFLEELALLSEYVSIF